MHHGNTVFGVFLWHNELSKDNIYGRCINFDHNIFFLTLQYFRFSAFRFRLFSKLKNFYFLKQKILTKNKKLNKYLFTSYMDPSTWYKQAP